MIVPDIALRLLVVLSFLVLVIVNVASGGANARISEKYPTLLTPSGYAFSIWGIIFFLQGIYTVYVALPYGYDQSRVKAKFLRAVAVPLTISWGLQCFWQLFFNGESFEESTVCIVGSFVTWMWTLHEIYWCRAFLKQANETVKLLDHVIYVGTAMNTAWISAATSIQLLIVAVSLEVADETQAVFAVLLPGVITMIAMYVIVAQYDFVYPCVVIWASAAIQNNQKSMAVQTTTSIVNGLMIFGLVVLVLRYIHEVFVKRLDHHHDSTISQGLAEGLLGVTGAPGGGFTGSA
jgi:hypothetical protein